MGLNLIRIAARIAAQHVASLEQKMTIHRLKDGTPVYEEKRSPYRWLLPDGRTFDEAFPDADPDQDIVTIEVVVTGQFIPGERTTHDHPGSGSEIADVEAETKSGQSIELTADEEKEAISLLETAASGHFASTSRQSFIYISHEERARLTKKFPKDVQIDEYPVFRGVGGRHEETLVTLTGTVEGHEIIDLTATLPTGLGLFLTTEESDLASEALLDKYMSDLDEYIEREVVLKEDSQEDRRPG
jgi:hypothetical protein